MNSRRDSQRLSLARRITRSIRKARSELRTPSPVTWQVADPAAGDFTFVQKVVVITGAAGRVGAGLTEAFLAMGARVYALDNNSADLEALSRQLHGAGLANVGDRFIPRVVDIADTDSSEMFSREVDHVDVLIHGAVVHRDIEDASALTPAVWRESFDTNVIGPAHLTTALTAKLSARQGANVVFITSINAVTPSRWVHYGAAKAAVAKMVEDFARDFSSRGIRVNAVGPGWTLDAGESADRRISSDHPLANSAIPVEAVVHAVAFLADSARSPMTTGQHLVVDGGRLLYHDAV